MGIEQRRNGYYYYRKRREGARVVSEYVGSGLASLLIASDEEEKREERAAQRTKEHNMRATMAEIDRELDMIEDDIFILVHATLLSSGYHLHKGEWRRSREQQ